MAEQAIDQEKRCTSVNAEILAIEGKLRSISSNLDQMYADRLAGLLDPDDFQRIYLKIKSDRERLTRRLKDLEKQKESPVETEDEAKVLAQRFIDSATCSRELLVSLIERIEFSKDRELYIKFRFKSLNP